MTDQLTLSFDPPVEPAYLPAMTITERFEAFHKANGHVAENLAYLARQLVAAGHTTISMKLLFERLRWEWALRTTGDTFKLNNDFTALYARLVAHTCPDLADAFRFRARRAA